MLIDDFHEKPHDLNELLNLIVEKATTFTHCERAVIFLFDEHEALLWNRAGTGAEFMQLQFKLGQGIPGKVFESGKSLIIHKAESDKHFDSKIDQVFDVPVKSVLATPIIAQSGNKIGVILLINKKEGEFGNRDTEFLDAVASQAAIGIENTLLFGKLDQARQKELEMAEQIRAQNRKLQDAYREVEEDNKVTKDTSASNNKKWLTAVVASIAGFLLISLISVYFIFDAKDNYADQSSDKDLLGKPEERRTFTVTPREFSFPITLTGTLEPGETENLIAPFSGRVVEKNFDYNEVVEEGKVLLKFNAEEIESAYRNALIDEINARKEYDKVLAWEESTEVIEATRSLERSVDDQDEAERRLADSEKLFELGVISKDERDRDQKQLTNARDKVDSEKDRLDNLLKKGDEKSIEIAQFRWENAALKAKELKEKLDKASLVSPVEGVVIAPIIRGDKDKLPEVGVKMDEGVLLGFVADLSKLSVLGKVDEVDIRKIKLDQEVTVSGDAFPGTTFKGKVVYVSSQAKSGSRAPTFDVRVVTETLTEEQRKAIRLGMSATLSIVYYNNPEAILIPFNAIKVERDEKFVYRINPETNNPEKVEVYTNITTPSAVEVVSGLNPGDEIVLLNL